MDESTTGRFSSEPPTPVTYNFSGMVPGYLLTVPDGEQILGAYNERLTERLPGGYGDVGSGNHSDVHLWYHGTVDTGLAVSDGEQFVTSAMRDEWYLPAEYGGQKAGFYFTRFGGGRWALDGFLFGYNDGNHNILPDTRVNLTRSASEWPSLIALSHDASGSVPAGNAFPVHYISQSYDSPSVTLVYLDPDQNPYNGNQIALSFSPDPTRSPQRRERRELLMQAQLSRCPRHPDIIMFTG